MSKHFYYFNLRNHRDDQPSTSYYSGNRKDSLNSAVPIESSKKTRLDSNSPPFHRESVRSHSNNNRHNNQQFIHLTSTNRSNIKDNFLRVNSFIFIFLNTDCNYLRFSFVLKI